jgi:hypothetical protein
MSGLEQVPQVAIQVFEHSHCPVALLLRLAQATGATRSHLAAQAAIAALHGQELAGRALNVSEARQREERRPSGGGPRSSRTAVSWRAAARHVCPDWAACFRALKILLFFLR